MRFVHSLSTRPLKLNAYNTGVWDMFLGNLAYYALSFSYIKNLGHEIVFYGDEISTRIFDVIPYDEIHNTLDNISSDVHPRFWAAAKIKALENEELGAVHIDGDVFIKSPKCVDIISQPVDLVTQCKEDAVSYQKDAPIFWSDKEFCLERGLDLEKIGAYNTGVLCFNNQELKDKFIKGYWDLAKHFSQKFWYVLDIQNFYTPDLISEQVFVRQVSEDYKTGCVLGDIPLEHFQDAVDRSNEIGYQHVLTNNKFKITDRCMDVLSKTNPELHKKISKLCRNILTR